MTRTLAGLLAIALMAMASCGDDDSGKRVRPRPGRALGSAWATAMPT